MNASADAENRSDNLPYDILTYGFDVDQNHR